MPKMIKVKDLKPHPKNEAIYGQEDVSDLIEQIKERGKIVVPLIITEKNVVLAGHRRLKAALSEELNLEEVLCEVRTFPSPEDELEFLLHDNVKRNKNKVQLAREGIALEEVLSKQAEERRKAALKQNQSVRDDSSLTDDTSADNDTDSPTDSAKGRVRDEVAKALKIGSGKQFDHMKAVVMKADELRKAGNIEDSDLFLAVLNRSASAANDLLKVDLASRSPEEKSDIAEGKKAPSFFIVKTDIVDKKKAKAKTKADNTAALSHLSDIDRAIKQMNKITAINLSDKKSMAAKEQITKQIEALQNILSKLDPPNKIQE